MKSARTVFHRVQFIPSSKHTEGQSFCSIFAPCKVIRNPGNFHLWIPESWVLEFGIQLKESRIPSTIGIRNPVLGIRSPELGSKKTKLSIDTYNFPVLYCISERPLETFVGTCDMMQQQIAYIRAKGFLDYSASK